MSEVRIEREHAFRWWVPNQQGGGTVIVGEGHLSGKVSIQLNDMDGALLDAADINEKAIPALIAALESYQNRIGASENES